MLNSITLGRIVLDGTYSTGLRSMLADARLASGLNDIGVKARLYSGKPDGRTLDVVRQLVRMRTDAYLFGVSDEVSAATCQLARGILDLRADARILFWAATQQESLHDLKQLETLGSLLIADRPEQMLEAMLRGVTPKDGVDLAMIQFSPYRRGLLSAEDVSRYGLTAQQSLDSLRDEVLWLAAQHLPAETIVPIFAVDATEAGLLELCQMFAEASPVQTLELHASAGSVTQAVLDAMSLARIHRLAIKDGLSLLPLTPSDSGVEIVDPGNARLEPNGRRILYSRNGVLALHAGIYPDPNQAPAVQHFEVPLSLSPEDRRRAYEWVAPNLAMRSAVVLHGPIERVIEHLPHLLSPANDETSGWPKHSYAIGFEQDPTQAQVFFDGHAETGQTMQYVPLSELDSAADSPGLMTFITVRTSADLVELKHRLHDFHHDGLLHVKKPGRSVLFENSCRWMGYSACQLLSLRRLQVVETDKLMACRDSGDAGHVGSPFEIIVSNFKQRRQIEEVRRECATCNVRDSCSKCINLPESLGGHYCEVRKTYPQSPLFFALAGFPQLISQYIKVKEEEIEVRISCTGLPLQYYKGATGVMRKGQRPVIATVVGQNFVWWVGTRRLIRLSAALALMAEAWWSGSAEADVTRELCQTFNVDEATAVLSLAEGYARLKTEGITS